MTSLAALLDTLQDAATDHHQAKSHGTHGDQRVKDTLAALIEARSAVLTHVRKHGYKE